MHSIYCKVKERIHGETSHAISIKKCKCMNGWWMDMAYSLRHWFSLLTYPLCFETWLLLSSFFSLFFWGHASSACHLFSFWGNHNLILFCFRDMFYERVTKTWSIYLWMVAKLIPSVGISQMDGDVCVLMIERA